MCLLRAPVFPRLASAIPATSPARPVVPRRARRAAQVYTRTGLQSTVPVARWVLTPSRVPRRASAAAAAPMPARAHPRAPAVTPDDRPAAALPRVSTASRGDTASQAPRRVNPASKVRIARTPKRGRRELRVPLRIRRLDRTSAPYPCKPSPPRLLPERHRRRLVPQMLYRSSVRAAVQQHQRLGHVRRVR